MNPRLPFALAALALLPFALTGCTGGNDKPESAKPAKPAAKSPADACAKLEKSLNELGAGIRNVDAAMAALIGDSVTDPAERNAAFLKSLKKVNTADVKTAVDEVTRVTGELATAWEKTAAALTDPGARVAAEATRDDVNARKADLINALRQVDTAIAAHKKLLREVRTVLTDAPAASQIVRARPSGRKLADLGLRVGAAINGAVSAAQRLAKSPVPTLVDAVEEKPLAPAPAKSENLEHADHVKDAPVESAKAAEPAKPADAPAKPAEPASGVKTEPAAALAAPAAAANPPAEPKPAAPEPKPAPATTPPVVDPVPEPVEA